MAKRQLYSAVAARVRKLRKPSECIWHWSEYRPGEVSVLLIGRRSVPALRKLIAHYGEGGCGRTLEFRKVKGRWLFVGEGDWIS
jgi:hypothetical protein